MTNTLSIIDVSGVQGYIFGSNKLQEQIGASALVRHLTEELIAKQAVEGYGGTIAVAGGGNVLFTSDSLETARRIARAASELALRHTPGLDLYAAHVEVTGAIGGKDGAYNTLFAQLGRQKQQRRPSDAAFSLGVTAECAATGAPATAYDSGESRVISAELVGKITGRGIASKQLTALWKLIPDHDSFIFVNDFDELGRSKGEQSQIAVVHADGNGFGQRFRDLVEQSSFADPDQNAACLRALKELSDAIELAGSTAIRATIAWLIGRIQQESRASVDVSNPFSRFAHQLTADGEAKLPFRPLVFGGDDVTFVCDGRLGLPLAVRYLHEFEQATKNLPVGGPGYAAAGVSIVRSHYPFARAYAICEQLCASAKKELREAEIKTSALDWHVAQSGLAGSLAEIRNREYAAGSLLQRPLTLQAPSGFQQRWRSWPAFVQMITAFNEVAADGKRPGWGDQRNKLIPLRDELRGGAEQTKRYREAFNLLPLPGCVGASGEMQTDGWHDGRAAYFDAIEAIDLLLLDPLSGEGGV